MKKSIILFLFIFTIFFANAQDKIKECLADADNIEKLIADKKYNEIAFNWFQIEKKCPNLNEQFYKNGEIVFEYKKEMSNTVEDKKSAVIDIIKVLDKYDSKFPDNKNGNAIKKALYLSDYKIGTEDEIFQILDKSFKKDKENFKNPQALYLYFNLFVKQLNDSKNGLTTNDLYAKYYEINQKINEELKQKSTEAKILIKRQNIIPLNTNETSKLKSINEKTESLNIVSSGIKNALEPYITCDNLIKYSNIAFDNNQNDHLWLLCFTEFLFSKNCYKDPIVEKITTKNYENFPDSKAAFQLGYIKLLKNNIEQSNKLFAEAIEKQEDNIEKAKIYYTIATVVYGINNKPKAAENLQKAIENDPNFAKPYLYLAQLYENADECFATSFDKKAINWLIAETLKKAGKADKMFEPSTTIQAEKYLKKAPTTAEIQTAELKIGKKYLFKCWINQSIEIPKS